MGFTGADAILINLCDLMQLLTKRYTRNKNYTALGRFEDIEAITTLIQEAIKEMEKHNIYQWDEIYPTVEDFEDDIKKREFVCCRGK